MDSPGSYASQSGRRLTGVEIAATRDLYMDAIYAAMGGENYHSGLDFDICLI